MSTKHKIKSQIIVFVAITILSFLSGFSFQFFSINYQPNTNNLPKIFIQKKKQIGLIPNKIYLTYRYDLCNVTISSQKMNKYQQMDANYFPLLINVQKILSFNKNFEIQCFNDTQAYNYIKSKNERFADYFLNEKLGCYKADIFRLIILYYEGGYYFDCDMEPMMSLNDFISKNENTTLISVIASNKVHIFQSFLGSTKYNPIIKLNLDFIEFVYTRKRKRQKPMNMGTRLLAKSLFKYTNKSMEYIQSNKYFGNQTIRLLNELIYNGNNAEYILSQRIKGINDKEQRESVSYAIYDSQNDVWPLWSRIASYNASDRLIDLQLG